MRIIVAGVAVVLGLTASAAKAQQDAKNPISNSIRRMAKGSARNIVGAAESMPADKWNYKATPDVMSFGEIMAHVADDNTISCGGIAGASLKAPAVPKPTDSREQIISGLRNSFAFCDSALAKIDDSQLGKSVSYYGSPAPMGAIVLGLANDWGSHYSQSAVYLRLNKVLPPTARPRSKS
jgi:hypothetical protein